MVSCSLALGQNLMVARCGIGRLVVAREVVDIKMG